MPVMWVTHKNLGKVLICDQRSRSRLNQLNPDPTSIFVGHENEIKEVSKSLIVWEEKIYEQ